ncbi:MAG TPA: N-acetylmuramoyl-L-alanine amidase [Acidocella sp.]|nr:N-acetylmuramoyl-L-alanine amidase [Acidocella sp.]HQU03667.1 N-acetylmuramoyl-L-alanine amidase [Acidocella sp.]
MKRRDFGQALLGLGAGMVIAQPRIVEAATAHKLPLIMLDPGHGGHDPGAMSPDGTEEKHITLAAGFAIKNALLATGRYRVAMTRTHDQFIALEQRVALAVGAKADLFMALHCDHLPTPDLRGASIFTLSSDASDDLAASIAADENQADQTAGPAIQGVSPQVANVLASLETRATRIGSATFAEDIRNSFKGAVPLLPDPLRSANFAVLRDPSVPSTLLEMGCLTNPLDEKLLRSPKHRTEMAERLTAAIDLYFHQYAPAKPPHAARPHKSNWHVS